MRLEDFKYTATASGYMIQYKGQNIGGAGIIGKYKGRKAAAQAAEYGSNAQDSINALVSGRGEQRYLDVIARIDAESAK